MYRLIIKRFLDIVISFILLVLCSPFIVLFYFILFFVNKGNPIFFQTRPGKNGKLFKVIKFKTMTDAKDKNGNLLPDEKRITKVGQFFRKTSIDDGLQAINILKGDMSIVGPRPLLVEYLDLYTPQQHRRHEVRPGLTGWAQVNGRNSISWSQKFEYDVWYVDNVSLALDVKIFMLSLKKVFKSEGISANNHVTMEKFNGKN